MSEQDTSTITASAEIRQAIADLTRVAEWVDRLAADGVAVRVVDAPEARLYLSPGDVEAYHAITAGLVEVVDLGDPEAIVPPGASGGNWTDATVGSVDIVTFTPGDLCERVQVGTKVIEVPDPAAPKVRRELPVYEYRCSEVAS